MSNSRLELCQRAFEYYPQLKRLSEFMRQNPERRVSLAQAANIASMTPNYFSRFFHEKAGIRFKCWTDLVAVERAKCLFDASDISVTDAAMQTGFNDLSTFERTFKRIAGMTPRTYRRTQVVPSVNMRPIKSAD